MPCTTILVGKKASYDGSTMIARNDDGRFDTKKLVVVHNQPKKYVSKIAHLEIELPDNVFVASDLGPEGVLVVAPIKSWREKI